jgi:hypothetical protein
MRERGRKGVINCWGAQARPLSLRNPQGNRTRSQQGQMALNLVIESPAPPLIQSGFTFGSER